VLFAAKAKTQSRIIMARSDSLSIDLRQLIPVVAPVVSGKGGGGASLVEIVTEEPARLDGALLKAEEFMRNLV